MRLQFIATHRTWYANAVMRHKDCSAEFIIQYFPEDEDDKGFQKFCITFQDLNGLTSCITCFNDGCEALTAMTRLPNANNLLTELPKLKSPAAFERWLIECGITDATQTKIPVKTEGF